MCGHWIGKCWKFHPQLRPKRGKKVIHAPAKKKEANEGVRRKQMKELLE